MDNETAKKLRNKALKSSRFFGFHSEAEDIAQDVMLNYLIGNGKKQTVDYAVIDQIRKRLGRTPKKPRKEKSTKTGRPARVNPKFHSLKALEFMGDGSSVGSSDIKQFDAYIRKLPSHQRAVVVLTCIYGFSTAEIGYLFGMSPNSIAAEVDRIVNK